MHKTKLGEFKYLVVAIFDQVECIFNFVFCDSDGQAAQWTSDTIAVSGVESTTIRVFKDLNYLLNAMVKSKGSVYGDALYSIYIENYPDDDQKDKVIEFWSNGKVK